MKHRVRKIWALVLSLALLMTMLPVSPVAQAISPQGADEEDVIDYSHQQLAGWGYSFGLVNNELRFQTFTAPKDGKLEAVEVALYKKNAASVATPDVTAYLYLADENGLPTQKIAQSTMKGEDVKSATPGAEVTDDMITRFEFQGSVQGGVRYAIVLESAQINADGGKDVCYDWFAQSGAVEGEHFGKTNGQNSDGEWNWVIEDNCGTGWLKVFYAETSSDTIDYSFDTTANGYGFGAPNNEYRWQSFTATRDGALASIDVQLTKQDHNAESGLEEIGDLIVELRSMEAGYPKDVLATVTVPADQITSKEAVNIQLPYENLEKGVQYAIAMTMAEPLSQHGGYDCYAWPTSGTETAVSGEHFGKTNGQNSDDTWNWVYEDHLGTGWLRVNYAPIPDEIDYTFDSTSDGFGFGAAGNEYRWQSFTATKDGLMDSVDIKVTKFPHDQEKSGLEEIGDLIVELRTMENGLPAQKLASVVVPADEIENKTPKTVKLSYYLEEGKQYAIAMRMAGTFSTWGSYDCYGWATGTVAGAEGEFFGKTNTTTNDNPEYNGGDDGDTWNWVQEALGTGWLRVNYLSSSLTASSVQVSIEKGLLDIGEETNVTAQVFNKFGEVIENAPVIFTSSQPSIATVDENGKVTAVSGGAATITASSGGATATVAVSVKDEDGAIVPVPGMIVTEDIKFKPGVYDFGGAANGIIIAADDITVDGTGVTILNADPATTIEDVTTGAYAYELNPVEGKTAYNMTRKVSFGDASEIKLTFDAKAANFTGTVKVLVSEDGSAWDEVLAKDSFGSDWEALEADLSAYAGKEVDVRISYVPDGAVPDDLSLKLDTIKFMEDDTCIFNDLAEAKVFYWWDVSYEDGVRVNDSLKGKPFDRTPYTVNISQFTGNGIVADGVSGVTIKGFTVSGFYWAMNLSNCSNMTITGNDLSNNYTNPLGDWGSQEGGALNMTKVSGSEIYDNVAYNNANGITLRYSDENYIHDNAFAINSDVCLEMHDSSYNQIDDNDFSWGIRIDAYDEMHARDSTSQLMESGSNYNTFMRNDFTHGGDGIFIRVLDGWSCEGNWFEGNDTSYANNNAVESWAGRNYYINNKANHSSYGFWLGGSDESVLIGNEAAYNGINPHNAPEAFGNAGISIVNGSSEHMKIINNYIHDNYGPGIALRYQQGYPAHHYLIANNVITGNTTSAYDGNHKGYAIYLDQFDWAEITGNKIEGNSYDEVYTSSTATNVFVRDGKYFDTYEEYLANAPKASLTADRDRFVVGEEITFSGAGSTDPNGSDLYFRWDMGDGVIMAGDTVKYTFDEPGYYDVAFTVTNEEGLCDIAWLNVNVVAAGEEIGTDDTVDNWIIPDQNGKTTASNATSAEGPLTDYLDYYTYYVVDGDTSIHFTSTSGPNTMTYPKTMDAGYDFSDATGLSFSIKIQNESGSSSNVPVVRLYTDANNYVTYTPAWNWLSPSNFANYGCNQYRHEWVPLVVPFSGSDMWSVSYTGTVDFSNINYISFDMTTGGTMVNLWLDGLKTITTETPYYTSNLALDATVSASSEKDGHVASNAVGKSYDFFTYWQSEAEEESYYELDFGTERFVNRLDLYMHYNPTGNPALDEIGLPQSYTVEYLENGLWKPVNLTQGGTLATHENVLRFDTVETQKLRIVFENAAGQSTAVYSVQAYNTDNYASETDASGNPLTNVTSNIVVDATLDSIEMWVGINAAEYWPNNYGDFVAYIYEASADGQGPTGAPLASGRISKEDIIENGLNKAYTITMRDENGEKILLKAGKQYVVVATQDPVSPNDNGDPTNVHYRWPTGTLVAGEQYGKITYNDISNITSYSPENLGTGWLIVHTDKDRDGQATIDYSFDNVNGGYGLGHKDENSRYQTFTVPADAVFSAVDGLVNNDDVWSTQSSSESTNTVTLTFNSEKTANFFNVYFTEGHVPSKLVIKVGDSILAETDDLHAGFNQISTDAFTADSVTIEITNGDSYVELKEIEVMNLAEETESVNKSVLQALYDANKDKTQGDYTDYSWDSFVMALDAAKKVLDDPEATQEEVDQATLDLQDAIAHLTKVAVDKSELQALYDANKDKVQGDYTDESWQAFANALAAAKAVLEDADASQEEVDGALKALQNAIDGLKESTTEPGGSDEPENPGESSNPDDSGTSSEPNEPDDGEDTPATGFSGVAELLMLSALLVSAAAIILIRKQTGAAR